MLVRTASVALIHGADAAAKEGNIAAVERTHLVALFLQGIRIAIPAALLLAIPTSAVQSVLNAMPEWLSGGMAAGGGMVVAEIGRASCRERGGRSGWTRSVEREGRREEVANDERGRGRARARDETAAT